MKQLLFKQDYDGYYTETAIEPIKVSGSKLIHGVQVVCRELASRGDYIMDYGPQSITMKRMFDKPRRLGTMICEREFEYACQEIKKEMGL